MNRQFVGRILATTTAMMIVQAGHSGGGGGGPPEYEVDIIIPGPFCEPFGWEPAVGRGINDLGNICGFNFDCNNFDEALFWSPETGRIVLNLPPGTIMSRALDLNSAGLIVGWMEVSNDGFGFLGFVHDGEQYTNLGTLPGGNWSEAYSINEKDEIVGFWGDTLNGPSPLAFLWRDGRMIDIHPDFGTARSQANDINDQSQATGWMGSSISTDAHAFIWDNGKVADLGVIPGGFTGMGMAINDQADVAVRGLTFNDNDEVIVRSFLWRDGKWIDLGVLPGFEETFATDVNDAGQVIGRCDMLDSNASRPFLWQDGTMWDLNELWTSDDDDLIGIGLPWAMNASGQIILQGAHQGFSGVAVRLTPIVPPLGDIDGDGTVGVSDLLILLASWGPCANCADCAADLDDNCEVGVTDLLILLSNWG